MNPYNKKAIAVAALLSLGGTMAQAQSAPAASTEIRALRATVDELRKELEELKAQLKAQPAATPADPLALPGSDSVALADGEEESQEAVDARTPATRADIVGLRADLENYKYDQSRLQERNIPSVTRNTKIGGGITLRYDSRDPAAEPAANAVGTVPIQRRNAGFNAPQFTLNFSGNLFRDYNEGRNLTYRLAFTNQTTSSTSSNTVNATDAYIRYSFQPSTGNPEDPLGTITLGQQIVPFGLDPQALDPEVKAVIGNAGFVSGLGLNTRQIGLVVQGDYDPYVDFTNNYRAPLLAYAFGVYNGNGPNRADNNNHRDFSGRLVYTLPVDYTSWIRQLQIGTSYYLGRPTVGVNGYAVGNQTGRSTRQGFDINWTHLPFTIAYEWAYGKDRLATPGADGEGYQRGRGQYINFGYTWGEQFLASSRQQGKYDDYWPKSYQAFVRFDEWDPNLSGLVRNDKQFTTTLGLNMFFAETTKFQINYLRTRNQLGDKAPTADRPKTVNTLQAQFNATF